MSHKNQKSKNFQLFVELVLHILNTIKNIINDLLAILSYLLPNIKDFIL